MTGLQTGARSYYASSQQTKRCKSYLQTAACLLVHPVIEMRPGPEKKKEDFYEKFVFMIRNPLTAAPAHHNAKLRKYHNHVGQSPEEEWRCFRDEYLKGILSEWKRTIRVWKDSGYEIGTYLVYEHFMDVQKGIAIVQKLSDLFQFAGFKVAPYLDFPCIWYKSIGGRESLNVYRQYNYEYTNFTPGYTKSQKEILLSEVSSTITEFNDDAELVGILREYHDYIRDNTRLDRECNKKDL